MAGVQIMQERFSAPLRATDVAITFDGRPQSPSASRSGIVSAAISFGVGFYSDFFHPLRTSKNRADSPIPEIVASIR